jgi:hypothetical protein
VSVVGEVQGVWITAVVGFLVNLAALGTVAFKIGGWTSRVDAERGADRAASASGFEASAAAVADLKEDTAKAFDEIKKTLGNGAPGTVVRIPVCQALHEGVRTEIAGVKEAARLDSARVREDIRSLHDAVRELHTKP